MCSVQRVLASLGPRGSSLRRDAAAERVRALRAGPVVLSEGLAVVRRCEVRIVLLGCARSPGIDLVLMLGVRPLRDAASEGVHAVARSGAVSRPEETHAHRGAEGATGARGVCAVLTRRLARERSGRRDQRGEQGGDQDSCLHLGLAS